MNIFFYDVTPIEERYKEWTRLNYPGHLLYGLTHFNKYGINCIFKTIPFNPYNYRLRLSLYNLIRYIKISKKVDIIYGVTFRGLEFVIFFRALGLLKTPIVVWHHSGVLTPKNPIRTKLSSLFYIGFVKPLFFRDKLRHDS